MALEIIVPAPGESVSEVTISNWLVKEGDWVEMDAPIAEFESDKATFEVNAEKAGIIEKLIGNEGDTIAVNTVIALINTEAARPEGMSESAAPSAVAPATAPTAQVEKKSADSPKTESPSPEKKNLEVPSDLSISPVALQLLQEYN